VDQGLRPTSGPYFSTVLHFAARGHPRPALYNNGRPDGRHLPPPSTRVRTRSRPLLTNPFTQPQAPKQIQVLALPNGHGEAAPTFPAAGKTSRWLRGPIRLRDRAAGPSPVGLVGASRVWWAPRPVWRARPGRADNPPACPVLDRFAPGRTPPGGFQLIIPEVCLQILTARPRRHLVQVDVNRTVRAIAQHGRLPTPQQCAVQSSPTHGKVTHAQKNA